MRITDRRKQVLAIGALGAGALVAAQAWRRGERYDFAGKSVIVTGGSRGLGLVIARQLAAEGARLTLIARDEEEVQRAARAIVNERPYAEVLPTQGDVRLKGDTERAVAIAIHRFGTVDVLINNAGIIQVGPLDHMKLTDYEDAMDTNFWGPLHMVVAVLPHMRRQGHGRIVNISSIGGRISVPHLLPYSASKFALAGFSEGLRAELAPHNIVVTTIFPGLIRTGSPVNALFKGQRRQEYAWFAIADSLPVFSIDAERAARQIIRACRNGDAELIITLQARAAVLARTVVPELFAGAMALISRLLPAPVAKNGDTARPGHESESRLAGPNRLLTARGYKAAERNNEL